MTPKLQINLKDGTLNSIKPDEYLTCSFSVLKTILTPLGKKKWADLDNLLVSAITTDTAMGYRAERNLREHVV